MSAGGGTASDLDIIDAHAWRREKHANDVFSTGLASTMQRSALVVLPVQIHMYTPARAQSHTCTVDALSHRPITGKL